MEPIKKTLDGEMRQLTAKGIAHPTKQAEPITSNEEEILWKKGLLGETSPSVLLNTMVFMCGMYFALCSGQEHRELRFSQLQINEREGKKSIIYYENAFKANSGGLKHQKIERKVVTHYENLENPSRCFVRLYQKYISHCPESAIEKNTAFYLSPLKRTKGECWYSSIPVGHNTLAKTISQMCQIAGITGFKTNHSLRVTAATRLFQAGVDEQLIMKRTGHRSVDGVRKYK